MTRKSFATKLKARRNAREFDRAIAEASPSMQQELRAIAMRHQQQFMR